MNVRRKKQERWAPDGWYREMARKLLPEHAARLDAMDARRAAERAALPPEPEEKPAPRPRRARRAAPREGHDLEKHAVKAIERALTARGWDHEVMATGAGELASGQFVSFGAPGRPDIYVYPGNGLVVWLEVKSRTGRTSEAQRRWHERRRARGYVVGVVRTADEAIACVEHALKGVA